MTGAQDLAVDLARVHPAAWGHLVTRGTYRTARHIEVMLDAAMDAVRDGSGLIVTTPPRHSKSQSLARVFAGFTLCRWPSKRVVVASAASSLAVTHSKQARRDVEEWGETVFGVRVDPRSGAADHWELDGHQGGYRAVGVGTMLTGFGSDLLLVDDYCPDAEAALSDVQREAVWDWWESVASTRLEPGAAKVVFATRWHSDDLIGRLLTRETGRWRLLRLPALAESNDPLGRQPGEALWPERWPREALEDVKASKGAFWWSAMYQGSPVPEGGGIFKPAWWRDRRYIRDGEGAPFVCTDERSFRLSDLLRFVVVDTALTERQTSDYTVILACGVTEDRRLLILDMDRRRMEGPDTIPAVRSMINRWGARMAWVEQSTQSLYFIQQARREGLPIRVYGKAGEVELRLPTGGGSDPKVPTYYAATPMVEAGRLYLPRQASWLADLEAEMSTVPYSSTGHDDAAETLAVACLLADHLRQGPPLWATYNPQPEAVPVDVRREIPRVPESRGSNGYGIVRPPR